MEIIVKDDLKPVTKFTIKAECGNCGSDCVVLVMNVMLYVECSNYDVSIRCLKCNSNEDLAESN